MISRLSHPETSDDQVYLSQSGGIKMGYPYYFTTKWPLRMGVFTETGGGYLTKEEFAGYI